MVSVLRERVQELVEISAAELEFAQRHSEQHWLVRLLNVHDPARMTGFIVPDLADRVASGGAQLYVALPPPSRAASRGVTDGESDAEDDGTSSEGGA